MEPEFLVLGHIVKDIVDGGWRPGGGVLYAAAQARALGLQVAAVTRCGPDIDPQAILPGVTWHAAPSDVTTSFENRYVDGRREQRLPALAAPLTASDVPANWWHAPTVLLAPVFHDVSANLVTSFTNMGAFLGLGAQGWLRELDEGKVRPMTLQAPPAWLGGDVVVVSQEDVADAESVERWREDVPVVVLTRGRSGCTVWHEGARFDLPTIAADEVDATGAGDVFTAAFLIRLKETGDPREAALFASAAASLSVRAVGIAGIAGRDEVEALMRREAVRT